MANVPVDQEKVHDFVGKVLGDTSGLTTTILAALGDRLNLFKTLAAHGPASSAELAKAASINERYAREWLGGMASAGYVQHDPATRRFTLPPEHVPVLAEEAGPMYFGGAHQMLLGTFGVLDQLTTAFRQGGGVAQPEYSEDWWAGMERFTGGWFENLLLPQWIPAMPRVREALERGVDVADVGCNRGRALIKLARAFPRSRFVGYDVFEPAIRLATERAAEAGLADRIRFEQRDVSKELPEQFDVITTFDVIHDAVDPLGLLRTIRQALRPGGTYVCLDINCSDKLEENAGPLGALFHGFSVLYCMTTSLSRGGAGLGTMGLPESKLKELANEAGFADVRRVPLENPFNNLYEVTV
ncbi:MAG TPA: class I SAM-dependent methyltransferase [Thermoleophilaceae bacterium]|jgi:2-polyprenyl-3-methyl-5-hydroxy-6-metoxy-1,4-benzoquinol methylase